MSSFICKQPNGRYCRFSTFVSTITHYNMTENDYINMKIEEAIQDAKDALQNHTQSIEKAKEEFAPDCMTKKAFKDLLEEMGKPTTEGMELIKSK